MIWCIQDLNKRIWESERDHPSVDLWSHPMARVNLQCDLWLLEPADAMSGIEQEWRLNGLSPDLLGETVRTCLSGQATIDQSEVAVAMMELPIFKFNAGCWEVGVFDTKDQVRLRRVVPLGLLLTMREVISQASRA